MLYLAVVILYLHCFVDSIRQEILEGKLWNHENHERAVFLSKNFWPIYIAMEKRFLGYWGEQRSTLLIKKQRRYFFIINSLMPFFVEFDRNQKGVWKWYRTSCKICYHKAEYLIICFARKESSIMSATHKNKLIW